MHDGFIEIRQQAGRNHSTAAAVSPAHDAAVTLQGREGACAGEDLHHIATQAFRHAADVSTAVWISPGHHGSIGFQSSEGGAVALFLIGFAG